MKRKEVREVVDNEATIVRDADGDEIWIYWADGKCALGVASGVNLDENGKAAVLRVPELVEVIKHLTARLHTMLREEQPGATSPYGVTLDEFLGDDESQ